PEANCSDHSLDEATRAFRAHHQPGVPIDVLKRLRELWVEDEYSVHRVLCSPIPEALPAQLITRGSVIAQVERVEARTVKTFPDLDDHRPTPIHISLTLQRELSGRVAEETIRHAPGNLPRQLEPIEGRGAGGIRGRRQERLLQASNIADACTGHFSYAAQERPAGVVHGARRSGRLSCLLARWRLPPHSPRRLPR